MTAVFVEQPSILPGSDNYLGDLRHSFITLLIWSVTVFLPWYFCAAKPKQLDSDSSHKIEYAAQVEDILSLNRYLLNG